MSKTIGLDFASLSIDEKLNDDDSTFDEKLNDEGDMQSSPSTSRFSNNRRMSSLIGTGRALGNLFNKAGRHLEKTIDAVAHKVGFGPNATYARIQEQYYTNWHSDEQRSEFSRWKVSRVQLDISIIFH